MRFLTVEQCRETALGAGYRLGSTHEPARPSEEPGHVRCRIPVEHARLAWFCRHLEQSLRPREACLLWLTEWGIWPSSENPHLYNRLRQSYGDQRPLHEAPGHLFISSEASEFITFVQVSVLSGWGGHVLPVAGHGRAFLSHDEFVEFSAADPGVVASFRQPFVAAGSAPAA